MLVRVDLLFGNLPATVGDLINNVCTTYSGVANNSLVSVEDA